MHPPPGLRVKKRRRRFFGQVPVRSAPRLSASRKVLYHVHGKNDGTPFRRPGSETPAGGLLGSQLNAVPAGKDAPKRRFVGYQISSAYPRLSENPSSVFPENPQETAPVGQTVRHFPQRMHSPPQIFSVTSTAMGHTRSQAPHPTHFPVSTCIRKKLNRLNRA